MENNSRRYKLVLQCKIISIIVLLYFLIMLPLNESIAENTNVFMVILGSLFTIIATWMGFESNNKKYFIDKK
jgi:LytS/YehU family sensor histidine kinase